MPKSKERVMDTAKEFKPQTIFLREKIADHPEAMRIVELFPETSVKLVKHQRIPLRNDEPAGLALRRGKRILMIGQTTSFVSHFDAKLGSSVRCCPYYKLIPLSNGCPYYCTYCYLGFVYRKYHPFIKININYDTMFRQIRKAATRTSLHTNFNMGEMLDSLALDHITNLSTRLIPFFGTISNAYLMLLTKSCNIDNLLSTKPNHHTVVSWSLNTERNIEQYESGTASAKQRINAARMCQQHGYRIRFRIDPAIVYPDYKQEYSDLIEQALSDTIPENITIGMLRMLPGHKKLAIDAYGSKGKKLATEPLVAKYSDGKLRYHPQQRIKFYKFLVSVIRSINSDISIGLCRETPEIWQELKQLCKPHKCNCLTW